VRPDVVTERLGYASVAFTLQRYGHRYAGDQRSGARPTQERRPVKLYHRTDAAAEIRATGFRDARGSYMMAGVELPGVWISGGPLDENSGAWGDSLLEVVLDETLIVDYEVIEDGKPYREWCVPSRVLNSSASTTLVTTP
jgi:hypothetical protein